MTTEPIDPDVEVSAQNHEMNQTHGLVLAAIAMGGGLGSLARWSLSEALPNDTFPWATFMTNVTGSFLIGILLVLITYRFTKQKYLRPFFGVGFLGGFTTFSTYTEQTVSLLNEGDVLLAIIYVVATVIAAMTAVLAGTRLARLALIGAKK